MTHDTFSVIFLEYRTKKYEHFLKVTFHSFAAHLKDYFSARCNFLLKSLQYKENIEKKKQCENSKSPVREKVKKSLQPFYRILWMAFWETPKFFSIF